MTGLLLDSVRKVSSGFTISSGDNFQPFIHVVDLARLYLDLLSDALKPKDEIAETQGAWGPEAYYFAEQDELPFKEYMEHIVSVLHRNGQLKSTFIKEIGFDTFLEALGAANGPPEAEAWARLTGIMLGSNTRIRASRARALGWKPQESGVRATIDEVWGKYLEAEKRG